MSRVCQICGKGVIVGNRIVRRGLEKRKGGIGLHTTGINRRDFRPNLQRVKVREAGSVRRKTVCAQCIRSGEIVKA
jgi:large subunit ribosomal protein L28